MATTMKSDLVIPQVMADMIEEKLPFALKLAPYAPIDNTLVGKPGDTVTLPAWNYIGDAADLAEGGALSYDKLTTDEAEFTVKKAAKGVTLTDEAINSGFGDPVGTATRQLTKSIASKVEGDIVTTALTTPLTAAAAIDLDVVDAIEDLFGNEDDERGIILLCKSDANALRKLAGEDWTRASDLGDRILVTGVFGELLGWQIVVSNRVTEGTAIAIKTDG
ncbi:N4-gp56 family major capsid protein, partial [Clostridia bacterium OttesenSCG-928-O13]|nr:N4-gp56 family major capsid protein [Clostridia bacterium OttesenSCG-928-O13]